MCQGQTQFLAFVVEQPLTCIQTAEEAAKPSLLEVHITVPITEYANLTLF